MNPRLIAYLISEDIDQRDILMEDQVPFLLKELTNFLTTHGFQGADEKAEKILEQLMEIDPTENKSFINKFVQWIKEETLIWPEDKQKLKQALKEYITIKNERPEFKNLTKFKSLQDLILDIDKILRPQELKTQKRRLNIPMLPGMKKLAEDDTYTLYEVSDPESAVKMSSGSKWCSGNINTAKMYIDQGTPLLIIFKNGKKYAQVHVKSKQLKDLRDLEVPENDPVREFVFNSIEKSVSLASMFKRRIPELEQQYQQFSPEDAVEYTSKVLYKRWPEVEPIILTSPSAIADYAILVIKARWPEGEKVILKPEQPISEYQRYRSKLLCLYRGALKYAYCFKLKIPKLEQAILNKQDIKAIVEYTQNNRRKWPEAEKILLDAVENHIPKAIKNAIYYNRIFNYDDWPELIEKIDNSLDAYNYCNMKQYPVQQLENLISLNPILAAKYAVYIKKQRWSEMEEEILENQNAANIYKKIFWRQQY